jgi:hypothetical protein
MVFVETMKKEDPPLGLVFKPEKIIDYHGEPLAALGFVVGAVIPQITWDPETLKVQSVSHITPRAEPTASFSM